MTNEITLKELRIDLEGRTTNTEGKEIMARPLGNPKVLVDPILVGPEVEPPRKHSDYWLNNIKNRVEITPFPRDRYGSTFEYLCDAPPNANAYVAAESFEGLIPTQFYKIEE